MRYQDYVIKNGKFIGRFDEMYRDSAEVPWHQDETSLSLYADLDVAIISYMNRLCRFDSIADIGCGLGYMTQRIGNEAAVDAQVSGFDISRTASDTAATLVPGVRFHELDILQDLPSCYAHQYDLVVCIELHWYALNNLDIFRKNIGLLSSKYIYIRQTFPAHDCYLGDDIFPDIDSLTRFWTGEYTAVLENRLGSSTGEKILQLFMTHEPGQLAKLGPAMTGRFPVSPGEPEQ